MAIFANFRRHIDLTEFFPSNNVQFCFSSNLFFFVSFRFSDKTKNDWEDKENFEKVPGKYDMLQMDYSDDSAQLETTDAVDSVKKEKKEVRFVSRKQFTI